MPRPDDFSEPALDAVTAELGRRLPRVLGRALEPDTVAEITASVQVWALTADRLRTDPAIDLGRLVVPTAQWHHQIAVDGKPELYARSTPLDPGAGTPEVNEIVRSPVVGRLDAAIAVADQSVTDDDDRARLVEAVDYHVWALWLLDSQGTGRVAVVDAPFDLPVARGQLVSDRELVRRLRQFSPIVGVRPD